MPFSQPPTSPEIHPHSPPLTPTEGGALGAGVQPPGPNALALDELIVRMGMERYAANIRRTVAEAPPLTAEQRLILRQALHGQEGG